MRKGLTIEDLGDLIELPLLAVLATYRRDGTVLLSPVWHEWRRAQLVTAGVADVVRRIASRYLGTDAGAAYAENAADDLLLRLEPGDLRAWDFADQL